MGSKWAVVLVAALVTSVFLAGCGAAEEFPTGEYVLATLRGEANQAQYNPDGTWKLMKGDEQISSGT